MAVDYADKEREFLQGLREDTGRDLAGWMAAIAATDLTERNAIIDWLRAQGFLFAKASWLERIHHNGGRPIYLDPAEIGAGPTRPSPPDWAEPPAPAPASAAAPQPVRPSIGDRARDAPSSSEPLPPPEAMRPSPGDAGPLPPAAPLDDLLAEAKAYRPLAQLVLREIEKAVPNVTLMPRSGYVSLVRGTEFGVLTIAPRELRLALAFGDRPAPAPFVKARFAKSHPAMPSAMTHMIVLTDARQVDAALVAAVRKAALAQG